MQPLLKPLFHSSNFPTQPTETSICRWNVGCTNPMCLYSHASPANTGPNGDPNALVLSQQNCRYGARCINRDCTRSHVSPAVARIQARSAAPVTFTPVAPPAAPTPTLSMDTALPSQTASRPCRFGAACTRADCFFSHPPGRSAGVPCRFGLGCTRADCYFSHPPGERAVGGGTSNRLHVFASGGEEEMERILPGAQQVHQGERDGGSLSAGCDGGWSGGGEFECVEGLSSLFAWLGCIFGLQEIQQSRSIGRLVDTFSFRFCWCGLSSITRDINVKRTQVRFAQAYRPTARMLLFSVQQPGFPHVWMSLTG